MGSEPPAAGFVWERGACGPLLRAEALAAQAPHFFTARDLPLKSRPEAWAQVAACIGVSGASRVRMARQVHGARVIVFEAGHETTRALTGGLPEGDVFLTADPTLALAVQTADCVPILMADEETGAVAAVHAGWRGTAARAAGVAVAAMAGEFGTRAERLWAAVGPSIGPCCYQVGHELLDAFLSVGHSRPALAGWFGSPSPSDGARATGQADDGLVLDLWRANTDQLVEAGLDPRRIAVARLCTACHPSVFPSYRREGAGAGRMAGVIRPVAR